MSDRSADGDIGRYLDGAGRVKVYPSKRSRQLCVLEYLASKFEIGRPYSETEVNELLAGNHTFGDAALLRRDLVDAGHLTRTRGGRQYWRPEASGSVDRPL